MQIISCTKVKSLKLSTLTWEAQICALVSLSYNCVTNPELDDLSWSNDNPDPDLFSVYFLIETFFFPLVIDCLILAIPNMHDKQRGTSSSKYRNIYAKNPIFASLNMELGWR